MSRISNNRSRHESKDPELKNSDLHFLRSQKVEEDLHKLYRFNQAVINTIPYGLGVVDEHGNILYLKNQKKRNYAHIRINFIIV